MNHRRLHFTWLALAAGGVLWMALGRRDGAAPVEVVERDRSVEGVDEDLLTRVGIEWLVDEPTRSAAAGDLGAIAGPGWAPEPAVVDEGAVLATPGRARLVFTAGPARDRTLGLRLRTEGGGAAEVIASLNGERIELGTIDGAWRDLRFEAPAALWNEGRNELDLELPAAARSEPRSEQPRSEDPAPGMAAPAAVGARFLARFDLGAEGTAGDADRGRLGPGEGLRLPLARLGGGRLELAAAGEGPGLVALSLAPLDPADGTAGPPTFERELELGAGPGRAGFDLPTGLDGLLRLELRWFPDDGAARLDLRELVARRRADDAPPLVLFLSADTLAARSMSLYGYGRRTTPFLERLAARAVVFDRAGANAGWTLPSYASQLTGLRPGALEFGSIDRLAERLPWETFQVPDGRLTLAELFAAAGYDTAAVIDSTMLDNLVGLEQGFATLDAGPSRIPPTDPSGGMELAAARVLERIDARDPTRPLFVFLQVVDVHGPYVTRPPWSDAFAGDEPGPRVPVVPDQVKAPGAVHRYVAEGLEPGAESVPVGPLRDAYDAKVLELDARIEGLVDALEARGLFDDALFVLSADHGEAMDEQGLYFRHGTAQEPVVHVPLVLKLPGDAAGGRRVARRVALVDLLPTFAELLGLAPEPFELHGRSLLRALAPAAAEQGADLEDARPVFVETEYLKQRAVLRGRWKLVLSEPWRTPYLTDALYVPRHWRPFAAAFPELAAELAGGRGVEGPPPLDPARAFEFYVRRAPELEEVRAWFEARGPDVALYDVFADPDETTDRSAEHAALLAELLELLAAARAADAAARATVGALPAPPDIDPAERARLVELGYLEPEPPADDRR